MEKMHHLELLHQAEIEIIEIEREKIAKNLHDDVGVHLTGILKSFEKINRNIDNIEMVKSLIHNSTFFVVQAKARIKGITQELFPTTLYKLGFRSAISELCGIINETEIMDIKFFSDNLRQRLPLKIELQIFRVVQEVINNIIKYAEANEMKINISGETLTIITICHNGKQLLNEDVKKLMLSSNGLGLKSIQTRAQYIGASIDYFIENEIPTIQIKLGE